VYKGGGEGAAVEVVHVDPGRRRRVRKVHYLLDPPDHPYHEVTVAPDAPDKLAAAAGADTVATVRTEHFLPLGRRGSLT